MPRVRTIVKSSRGRDRHCRRCGRKIQPGERHYYYSFRYGGTYYHCAEHTPRPSELTQSLMSEVYAAIENAQDQMPETETVEDIKTLVEEVQTAVDEVAEQYREAAEPFGGTGENADRADELESWSSELQCFDPDEPDEPEEFDEDATREEAERRYVYDQLPPDHQESMGGWEDVPEDPVRRQALMVDMDMDLGDAFTEFVDAFVDEQRPEEDDGDDALETARNEALELIGGCPL